MLEDKKDKLHENLIVNGSESNIHLQFRAYILTEDLHTYVTKFNWETAKYPVKATLRNTTDAISKDIARIDADLKVKAAAYNQLKNSLASLERKATYVFVVSAPL